MLKQEPAIFPRTVEHAGLGGIRKAGFDAAETTLIMALDGNDILLASACEYPLAKIQSVPGAVFSYLHTRPINGGEPIKVIHGFEAGRLRTGNYMDATAKQGAEVVISAHPDANARQGELHRARVGASRKRPRLRSGPAKGHSPWIPPGS